MPVDLKAYLALEASLSARVGAAWGRVADDILPLIYSRLARNEIAEATKMVDDLDLSPIIRETRDYVKYVSYASMLFGASRLNPNLSDAKVIGTGVMDPVVNRVVASFAIAINTSVSDMVKEKLYGLIQEHDNKLPQTNFAPSEGNVVFKATDMVPLLQPYTAFKNPVNSEAQRLIQIVSGLHTSRLAGFGFTQEAALTGVTQYMVNEQLDDRVCPVCVEMHGQTFDVSDASSLLDRVLTTDDPAQLQTLQPWPSQSKAAVQALRSMSTQDIVDMGWQIPPYHPYCRGQLVPVGDLPNISDTASAQAAFPDFGSFPDFNGDFSPAPIDANSFDSLGVDVTDAQAAAWDSTVNVPPDQPLSLLTGMTPQDMSDAAYNPITDSYDSSQYGLDMSLSGSSEADRLKASIDMNGNFYGSQDPITAGLDFVYDQISGVLHLRELGASGRDQGSANSLLGGLLAASLSMGVDTLELDAGLDPSGKLWADYGALPDSISWQDAADSLKAAIDSGDVDLTDDEKALVAPILDDPNPEAFGTLIDLDIPAVTEFMSNAGLTVTLDLTDEAAVQQFQDAIG